MPRLLLLLSVAFVLAIIPLPEIPSYFRPSWVFMLVLYIQFFLPNYFNVVLVFFTGLFLDVLLATTLGEHAFSMLLTTWIAAGRARRFTFFSLAQQIVAVGFFCFLYQFFLMLLDAFLDFHYEIWPVLYRTLTNMLLWPWLKTAADKFLAPKKKYGTYS